MTTREKSELFCAYVGRRDQLYDLAYTGALGLSEEVVKDLVFRQLRRDGFAGKRSAPRGKGPDIAGSDRKGRVVVEVKGEGARPQEFYNSFLNVLGQIVTRMDDAKARYIIALPIRHRFVDLLCKLPSRIRRELHLEFWLVGEKPSRWSIHVLYPGAE